MSLRAFFESVTFGVTVQKVRKKRCKQYFFAGVLLLSLSADVVAMGDDLDKIKKMVRQGVWAHTLGNITSHCITGIISPVVKRFTDYVFRTRPPQIIIRSSKGNNENLNQEMIFSDEVKLKLDDFASVAKQINGALEDGDNFTFKYRNLLLYGPPGTGKTMFAEKLARKLHRTCGMEWLMVTGSVFFQEGAQVKAVNDIFITEVKRNKKKGTIIIIDEADSLFSAREKLSPDSDAYRVINQLLNFMGTRTNDRMVIMTSNHPIFDDAMERRMDDAIKVPLPGHKERDETLHLYKKNYSLENLTDAKIKEIADNTEGFSQSDLAGIVDKLKMKSVIDSDADTDKNADTIVKEYCEKKRLFDKQKQNRDRDQLEKLKGKRL